MKIAKRKVLFGAFQELSLSKLKFCILYIHRSQTVQLLFCYLPVEACKCTCGGFLGGVGGGEGVLWAYYLS